MNSLKAKISFGLLIIFFSTGAIILFWGNRDVGRALLSAEEKSVRNVFHLVDLNVSEIYDQLLNDKVRSIQKRKAALKDYAHLSLSVFEQYRQVSRTKLFSESKAQQLALDWFQKADYGAKITWFAFDSAGKFISHPDPAQIGKSALDLKDISGRPIVRLMCAAGNCRDAEFAVFSGNKNPHQKKLGYFKNFHPWGWTVAAVIDLSDIEETAALRQLQTIKNLRDHLKKVKLPGNGSTFLFRGNGTTLIEPPQNFWTLKNGDSTKELRFLQQKIINQQQANPLGEYISLKISRDAKGQERAELQIYAAYFKPFDWYIAIAIPTAAIMQPVSQLLLKQAIIVAGIFLLALVITLSFARRLSVPLLDLAAFARNLPQAEWQDPDIDLSSLQQIANLRQDEIGEVARSLDFMTSELRSRVRDLVEATTARERITGELNVARKIQLGILPKDFPAFPERTDFDLFATLLPAREVGGDLYDFFLIDQQRLCFTIGDVSDKGTPAAMFMVFTRTLIKALAPHFTSPAALMAKINDLLCADNPNSMFVTLLIGFLDTTTGEIQYANGGHNPPLLLSQQQPPTYLKELSGPVVGGFPELVYRDLQLQLKPGDSFFLYTDGVTEAQTCEEELYSTQRLSLFFDRPDIDPPAEEINALLTELQTYMGEAAQFDDIAMLMLRYQGDKRGLC